MGVNYSHVVLYGFKLPYDEYDYDKFEEYYLNDQSKGDIVAIADSMGQRYFFIGILQFKSNDGRREMATIPIQKIERPSPTKVSDLLDVLLEKDLEISGEWNHYVFTHHW